MDTTNNEIAIHESLKSDKVRMFISVNDLPKYCSKKYAKRIFEAQETNSLWGCYFTAKGRLKAQFI